MALFYSTHNIGFYITKQKAQDECKSIDKNALKLLSHPWWILIPKNKIIIINRI